VWRGGGNGIVAVARAPTAQLGGIPSPLVAHASVDIFVFVCPSLTPLFAAYLPPSSSSLYQLASCSCSTCSTLSPCPPPAWLIPSGTARSLSRLPSLALELGSPATCRAVSPPPSCSVCPPPFSRRLAGWRHHPLVTTAAPGASPCVLHPNTHTHTHTHTHTRCCWCGRGPNDPLSGAARHVSAPLLLLPAAPFTHTAPL